MQQRPRGLLGFMSNFIASKGLDQKDLLGRVRPYVDIADDKLDYVGAILDMSTNCCEHTGIRPPLGASSSTPRSLDPRGPAPRPPLEP